MTDESHPGGAHDRGGHGPGERGDAAAGEVGAGLTFDSGRFALGLLSMACGVVGGFMLGRAFQLSRPAASSTFDSEEWKRGLEERARKGREQFRADIAAGVRAGMGADGGDRG